MDQNATWYGGKARPRRRCVRWGRSPPPHKKGTATQFLVHVYFGETAGWMNTPLGTEGLDLGPGHIVLDGVPAPRERGKAAPPLFGPCLLWPRLPISATVDLLLQLLKHSTNSPTYTTVDHCCPIKTHIHDVRRSQSF